MYSGDSCFNIHLCACRCTSQGSIAFVVTMANEEEIAFPDFEKFL